MMLKKGMLGFGAIAIAAGAIIALNGFVSADVNEPVPIGEPMSDFTMKDPAGKAYSLSEYKGKIVVLDFSSQECPYSRAGDPAIAKVVESYKDKDVVFLGIDSNKNTTPEQIASFVESGNETKAQLPWPRLKDEGTAYANLVGANQTPEMYIVDKDGKLAYHGALDNQEKHDSDAYQNYVAMALDDLLAGRTIEKPERKAYGCTIKR